MEILEILEEIEDTVEKNFSLFGYSFTNKEDLLSMLEELRLKMPDEIKQARWVKEERQKILADAEKEAEAILSEARQKALKNEQRIVDEAKEEARRIVKHAQDESLMEQKRAMDDVKKEIITVAGLMAQKVVSASIDTEIQESLVEETLKEMGDSTWLS